MTLLEHFSYLLISLQEATVFSSLVLWWTLDDDASSKMKDMGSCEAPSQAVAAGRYVAPSAANVSVVLDSEGDTSLEQYHSL